VYRYAYKKECFYLVKAQMIIVFRNKSETQKENAASSKGGYDVSLLFTRVVLHSHPMRFVIVVAAMSYE
jgi:hypothetical protein